MMAEEERQAALKKLAELNPEALTLEDFPEAFMGIGQRCGTYVAIYDLGGLEETMQEKYKTTADAAQDDIGYNILGESMGENTPVFFHSNEYLMVS